MGASGAGLAARLGRAIVRHRALLPLPVIAAAAVGSGARSASGWAIGTTLLVAGIALRLMATAALARDRGRLVTWGAYAWLRHPHDLGTAVAWIGLAVAAGVTGALPGVVAIVAMLFGLSARSEERELAARFADDWTRWHRRTPGWIPRKPVAALASGVDGAAAWTAERGALAGFAMLLVAVTLGSLAR